MTQIRLCSGAWDDLQTDAKLIRKEVFIVEQNIPEEEEWDAQDSVSLHFVVYDQHKAIATARLMQNNSIGRVAVLKAYRSKGIGRLLMLEMIQHAKIQQRTQLHLSSQVHAIAFYQGLGFNIQGPEYLDCGIPHIDMMLEI